MQQNERTSTLMVIDKSVRNRCSLCYCDTRFFYVMQADWSDDDSVEDGPVSPKPSSKDVPEGDESSPLSNDAHPGRGESFPAYKL